jgi:PAS domain S-box-containing protein
MRWQPTPYSYLLLAAAAISAALVFYAWRRRGTPGAIPLALLMAGVCVWAAGYALELSGADLPTKVLWAKVEYLGIVTVPPAWLAFALQYTGREGLLTRRNLILLSIIPLITLLLASTNEAHGLVWSYTGLEASGPFPALYVRHGAWFWIHWSYSYLLLLTGTVLLVSLLVRSLPMYRKQNVALLLAVSVPWVGNGVYVLGLSPVPNLDPTPFAFLLSGMAIAWALFRFRLLDLVPVARAAVVEGMSDGVIVLDSHNRIVDFNPAAQHILGFSASQAVGSPVGRVVPSLDILLEIHREAGKAHKEVSIGDGPMQRSYEVTFSTLRDQRWRGRTALLIVLHDITERKRAEEEIRWLNEDLEDRVKERTVQLQAAITELKNNERLLRQSEERYRTVVEQAAENIFVVDAQTKRILDANAAFQTSLGYTAEEIRQLTLYDIIAHDEESIERNIERILEEGHHSIGERKYRRKDGSLVDVEVNVSAIHYDGKEAMCAVAHDISERKRAEEEIRRLNEQLEHRVLQRTAQLEEANRELESFSYSVSHDLRAPIRHIGGFTQMLKQRAEPSLDETSLRYLDTIVRSTDRAGTLIDDLLSFSRMTRAEMRLSVVDMNRFLREVLSDLSIETNGRDIDWRIGELSEVQGDPSMLTLVLQNLLSNALKYTRPRDQAVIEVGSTEGEDEVVFCVRDNGVGFDEAYADKLFGVFQRLHGSEEFEGTGIGLAIVARIVHRHGGRVWAEGRVGEGATFYFSLPLPREPDNES